MSQAQPPCPLSSSFLLLLPVMERLGNFIPPRLPAAPTYASSPASDKAPSPAYPSCPTPPSARFPSRPPHNAGQQLQPPPEKQQRVCPSSGLPCACGNPVEGVVASCSEHKAGPCVGPVVPTR